MKEKTSIAALFLIMIVMVYYLTGLAKNLSYSLWYEDNVRQTVIEVLEERK